MNKVFRILLLQLVTGVLLYLAAMLWQLNHWPMAGSFAVAGLLGSLLVVVSLVLLFIFLIVFYIRNKPE